MPKIPTDWQQTISLINRPTPSHTHTQDDATFAAMAAQMNVGATLLKQQFHSYVELYRQGRTPEQQQLAQAATGGGATHQQQQQQQAPGPLQGYGQQAAAAMMSAPVPPPPTVPFSRTCIGCIGCVCGCTCMGGGCRLSCPLPLPPRRSALTRADCHISKHSPRPPRRRLCRHPAAPAHAAHAQGGKGQEGSSARIRPPALLDAVRDCLLLD